jgi:hypothetical protein
MTFLIISIIIIFLVYALAKNKQPKKKIYMINQDNLYSLINKHEIKEKSKFVSRDFSNALVVDEQNNLHIFYSKYKKENGLHEFGNSKFPYNQIIESETIIDSQSIYKTNRSSQLAGMAVGGLAFGSLGMMLGGLTSNKLKLDSIKSIDLKLTVEDINKPVYKINFLTNRDIYTNQLITNGYSKDSTEVKVAINNIEKWHGIMDVLIKKQNNVVNR